MRYILVIIFNMCVTTGFSQSKLDYVWLFGLDQSSSEDDTGYRIDFSSKPLSIYESNNGVFFDSNNASICDQNGQLLFFTNGCFVLNRNGEIMPNGDSLNYDPFVELFWADCQYGYLGTQNIMILPDPNDSNGYYVFHKTRTYRPMLPDSIQLNYSYVDMSLENGLGDVVSKNISYYLPENSLSNYFTAISHTNDNDWWIIQPVAEDSLFLSFLLDEQGIHRMPNQNSHEFFRKSGTSAAGTAKFSPDGSKYALYAYKNNLHVYDFDRTTGLLSNHKEIIIYDDIDFSDIRFNSVEWSPNSRFIYVAARDELFQVDMWEDDPQNGIRLIDTYNGTEDPFPTTFFLMAQGPDCRIYMCPTSSTDSYHVINKPDELGTACDFVQNGIKLPARSGVASMPNFPRFRVDEEEKCDPTIVSVFGDDVYFRRDIELYPNPASDYLQVITPDGFRQGTLIIRDNQGQNHFYKELSRSVDQLELDISALPAGIYHLELFPKNNPGRIFYGTQIIKQ